MGIQYLCFGSKIRKKCIPMSTPFSLYKSGVYWVIYFMDMFSRCNQIDHLNAVCVLCVDYNPKWGAFAKKPCSLCRRVRCEGILKGCTIYYFQIFKLSQKGSLISAQYQIL